MIEIVLFCVLVGREEMQFLTKPSGQMAMCESDLVALIPRWQKELGDPSLHHE
jgi:hypothetical protein